MGFRGIAVAVCGLAMVVLSGCAAPAAGPSGSTPFASTATPSATSEAPTEVEAEARTIVVRFDRLEIRDENAAVLTVITYNDEIEPTVAQLTDLIGAEPSIEDYPASNHSPATRRYDWGGIRIIDGLEVEGGATMSTNFRVVAEAPTVGGVGLTTTQGFAVGDDARAVEQALNVASERTSCWGPAAEYGPELGEAVWDGEPLADGVELAFSDDLTVVRALVAPQRYGSGCA